MIRLDTSQTAHCALYRFLMSGSIMVSFIARWKLSRTTAEIWDWTIFALALLVTLLYQVLSNFANDYGDGVKRNRSK